MRNHDFRAPSAREVCADVSVIKIFVAPSIRQMCVYMYERLCDVHFSNGCQNILRSTSEYPKWYCHHFTVYLLFYTAKKLFRLSIGDLNHET
jgi:hypothetical protein